MEASSFEAWETLWKNFVFLCTQQLLRESYRRTVLPNKDPKYTIWQTSDVDGEDLPPLGDTTRDGQQPSSAEQEDEPFEGNVSPISSEDFNMFDFFPSREGSTHGSDAENEDAESNSPIKSFEHINVDVLLQQFVTLFDEEFCKFIQYKLYNPSSASHSSTKSAKLDSLFETILQTFGLEHLIDSSKPPSTQLLPTTMQQLLLRRKEFSSSTKDYYFQFPSSSYTTTPLECKNFLEQDWTLLMQVFDVMSPIDSLIKPTNTSQKKSAFILEPLELSFVELIYNERIKDATYFWKICTVCNYMGVDPRSQYAIENNKKELFLKHQHELYNDAFREIEDRVEKFLVITNPSMAVLVANTTTQRRPPPSQQQEEHELDEEHDDVSPQLDEEREEEEGHTDDTIAALRAESLRTRRLYRAVYEKPTTTNNQTLHNSILKFMFILCYFMEPLHNKDRLFSSYIQSLQRNFQSYLAQPHTSSFAFGETGLRRVKSIVEWLAQQLFYLLLCNGVLKNEVLSSYAKGQVIHHLVTLLVKVVCDRVDDLQA